MTDAPVEPTQRASVDGAPRGRRTSRRVRARRTRVSEPRSQRLASSIRVPVITGAALLGLIAVVAFLFLGRTGEDVHVPDVVGTHQEALTYSAAQQVRRGLNEGVDDLEELALALAAARTPDELTPALVGTAEIHDRYAGLHVIDRAGNVVAGTGGEPQLSADSREEAFRAPGMRDARRDPDSTSAVVTQWAPIPARGDPRWAVVAQFDTGFLRFSLDGTRPGDAWIVNRDGRVVSSLAGAGRLEQLGRAPLRDAVGRALNGQTGVITVPGGLESAEVVGHAPVTGLGPGSELGWAVVTARAVSSLDLPEAEAASQARVLSVVLLLVTVLVLGWVWIVIVRPVLRLQREAERVAFGDLSRSVEVIRYDEIGLIARSLERMRVLLIRKRVTGSSRPPRPNGDPR